MTSSHFLYRDKIKKQAVIDLSRKEDYVGYQLLSDKCGLNLDMSVDQDRFDFGRILDKISIFERSNNRPLLSSLVINYNGYCGNGFFKMALKDPKLDIAAIKKLTLEGFDKKHRNEVKKFWRNPDNSIYEII